jgi:hypothetical protein
LESGKTMICQDTQPQLEDWHTTLVHHRAFMIFKEIQYML